MKESLVLSQIEAGIKEGSAIIARELIINLEQHGLPPVIAIDGKIKNLRSKVLEISQIEKLPELLKKHGFTEDDFCFMEDKKTKFNSNKTVISCGSIICVSKKSGKIKEYPANHGSSWITDFQQDLKNKFFN